MEKGECITIQNLKNEFNKSCRYLLLIDHDFDIKQSAWKEEWVIYLITEFLVQDYKQNKSERNLRK